MATPNVPVPPGLIPFTQMVAAKHDPYIQQGRSLPIAMVKFEMNENFKGLRWQERMALRGLYCVSFDIVWEFEASRNGIGVKCNHCKARFHRTIPTGACVTQQGATAGDLTPCALDVTKTMAAWWLVAWADWERDNYIPLHWASNVWWATIEQLIDDPIHGHCQEVWDDMRTIWRHNRSFPEPVQSCRDYAHQHGHGAWWDAGGGFSEPGGLSCATLAGISTI